MAKRKGPPPLTQDDFKWYLNETSKWKAPVQDSPYGKVVNGRDAILEEFLRRLRATRVNVLNTVNSNE